MNFIKIYRNFNLSISSNLLYEKINMQKFMSYFCPESQQPLFFEGKIDDSGKPISGFFRSKDGVRVYPMKSGIPDFNFPPSNQLSSSDLQSLDWYRDNAQFYDEYLPLTFETFKCDEEKERGRLIEALQLTGSEVVLEFGCGTGRDSELIARKLNNKGRLFLQDISHEILNIAVKKFENLNLDLEVDFSLANGYFLPFADQTFDRIFHFGGLNTFGDKQRTFREIVRVSKPGAKIVIGDESMPPWLRDLEFGKVLMNSNPHYKYDLPLKYLPAEARNVKVEWFIGGVFYFITFDIGDGLPYANFDFEIPGPRGGTHRTRYHGQIEGVSREAQDLAIEAQKLTRKSMHRWLNEAIISAAKKDLGK